MKKNIIIAGAARTGKSTLASLISKKYGYQHIAMDALIEGFEDLFPEMNIDTHKDSIEHISRKIAPFINSMFKSGEYDKFDYGLVVDVCQLLPEHCLQFIDSSLFEIYYLFSDCSTPEERLRFLDEFDDENEYTFYKNKEVRFNLCKELVDDNNLFKSECIKHNLPFYNTIINRKDKFETILNLIQADDLDKLSPQHITEH